MATLEKLKLAFIDDHRLFRKGLISLLELSFPDLNIVFEADDGNKMKNMISGSNLPDIIIMDINMPGMDGFESVSWLKKHFPEIPILVVSMIDDEEAILKMVRLGVKGYLTKGSDHSEITTALNTIRSGGFHYTDFITGKLVHAIQSGANTSLNGQYHITLNERETDFLRFACSDDTYSEIAKKMYLSPKTIDGYRDNLFEKLQVKSRVGLAIYAIKNGIFKI
jgi:DNA-binding NarL/FixJ family response regulator